MKVKISSNMHNNESTYLYVVMLNGGFEEGAYEYFYAYFNVSQVTTAVIQLLLIQNILDNR